MSVAVARFLSITTSFVKISMGFITIGVSGYMLGPIGGALVGALSDFIGAHLFPKGPYFPGFTISAALSGLTYGIFLYRKKPQPKLISLEKKTFLGFNLATLSRLTICVLIIEILYHLFLNTYWISLLQGKAMLVLLSTRFVKYLIEIPVHIVILAVIITAISKLPNSLLDMDTK